MFKLSAYRIAGGRYIVESTGLKIQNITEEDNGEYQCRAEVQSDGRLDMRQITVEVHSE